MTKPTPHGQVPEALRLAEWLDGWGGLTSKSCAAELRRLHAENESLAAALAEAQQQAAPKAAPGELHDHQILAITTAYEQGVGKGRQAHESGKEIANPYGTGYRCDLAWQYGYEEGKEQAERIAMAAPQQEAQEPVAWESTMLGYIKYITQAQYEKFRPNVRRWYKPYKCSSCAAPQPAPDCHHRPPCDECRIAAQGNK